MRSRKPAERGFGKALDLWGPPEGAGDALVCIATTFTFDAAFFETDCLGRFLQMDAHPSEGESVAYLVEREEKLAAARVCVLADRRHARDKESLRWDVLGVMVPRAIQHAKVALLVWRHHVRVIIGSGNLTQPGYRQNLEVFGAFDLTGDAGPRDAVHRTIDFLSEVLDLSVGTEAPDTPRARARAALRSVATHIQGWGATSSSAGQWPAPVFGTPARSVVMQLASLWPSSLGPARQAYVVSPFFDTGAREQAAVEALVPLLAKKRPREIGFDVRAEVRPDGRVRAFAPLAMVTYASQHADTCVRRILQEQNGEPRGLHAKMVYLANDHAILLMTGSSNFTAAGIGARDTRNLEANIVYCIRTFDPDAAALQAVWPATGEELDPESSLVIWDPQGEEEEAAGTDVALPAAFQEATFTAGPDAVVTITLQEPLPAAWTIRVPDGPTLLASVTGTGAGAHVMPWIERRVPFVLEVAWTMRRGEIAAVANWPVNVSDPATLPPPEELRGLTLEDLLAILASTRPLPQAVADALRRRASNASRNIGEQLDPLKRFDSRSSLLARTRRVAAALERMRERLERPAASRDAFEWRLYGPIGPIALADAFAREAALVGEARFCLAELALALRRVRPALAVSSGLPVDIVRDRLGAAIARIARQAADLPSAPELDAYVLAAFEEAGA